MIEIKSGIHQNDEVVYQALIFYKVNIFSEKVLTQWREWDTVE
jgi:hypothetical protein